MSASKWQIAVDTGGTFTDCIGRAPDGHEVRAKVLSSGRLRGRVEEIRDAHTVRLRLGADFPDEFFDGGTLEFGEDSWKIRSSAGDNPVVTMRLEPGPDGGLEAGDLVSVTSAEEAPVLGARILTRTPFSHPLPPIQLRLGTTRATNALLEEKGAPVAFFVTAGFGDLLRIGDQTRPDLFALEIRRAEPLHHRVFEIDERIDAAGEILTPLDAEAMEEAARRAREAGCTVAAIAFLHSYRNPQHEKAAAAIVRDAGLEYVAVSSLLAQSIHFLSRAGTAVIDAYLGPVMENYLDAVQRATGDGGQLHIMTSAGGLVTRQRYRPKDALLSGPAGGVMGSAAIAQRAGFDRVLAFDMGGTSTDVSRYDGAVEYRETHTVGRARLLAPGVPIETVAAGGGSLCGWDGERVFVGPESCGADPGPACYGSGGPLAITDVNLLLGRFDPSSMGIPIDRKAAESRLAELIEQMTRDSGESPDRHALLEGFLDIANNRMAEAIRRISVREGYDPAEYALNAFGGAGGMHACAVADLLGMNRILFPADAGILSALGIQHAHREAHAQRSVLEPEDSLGEALPRLVSEAEDEARETLASETESEADIEIAQRVIQVRLTGQDSTLAIDWSPDRSIREAFLERYENVFHYIPEDRTIEVVSLRVAARTVAQPAESEAFPGDETTPQPEGEIPSVVEGRREDIPWFRRESLHPGDRIDGPALILDDFATLVVDPRWRAHIGDRMTVRIDRIAGDSDQAAAMAQPRERPKSVERELFLNRFHGIVEEMGQQLRRTALSTNIKERLDFSCALLDADGRLVVNAPHIPVHLGALGECVRAIARRMDLGPGDVVATNEPGAGGTHLPDITLVSPVFVEDRLLGYVANRAHHAEIGGAVPGSMPPEADSLEAEGVVLEPRLLVHHGRDRFEALRQALTTARFPSRAPGENIADLRAQLSANTSGVRALRKLAEATGTDTIVEHMDWIRQVANRAVERLIRDRTPADFAKAGQLDDGTKINVSMKVSDGRIRIAFHDLIPRHPGNLNATPAIVRSACLYFLRLLAGEDLPLNEGLLDLVDIELPTSFLNPDFGSDPASAPPVAGGNVETSQRIVELLLLGSGLCAASQGTMNNVIFGNDGFSVYETVGGGSGAGDGFAGADGVHTHMTNTAITDAEVLEHRFPVRIRQFALRAGSGGPGRHRGGCGLVREIEFLESATLSVLTQHRDTGPAGLEGGQPGQPGRQSVRRIDGRIEVLPWAARVELNRGDRFLLETPGGGGYGDPRG